MSESFKKIGNINLGDTMENLNGLIGNLDSKVEELKLGQLSNSLTEVFDEAKSVIEDENLKQSLENLNGALAEFHGLGKRLNSDNVDQTLAKVDATLEEARLAAKNISQFVEPDSPTATRLNSALSQLNRSAASVRNLADFLRQNPNALVTGKKLPK